MPLDYAVSDQQIFALGGNLDLEIPRLAMLERRKIERAGSLFPERKDELDGFEGVLDIMSGLGIWTLSVAQTYPEIDVVGLERHGKLLDYARGQAKARRIGNVCYHLWDDVPTKLAFPDNFFDLVNTNYLFLLLHEDEWPRFFQECLRITRPGGYIRVFEQSWGVTNSPAIEQLADFFLRGLKKAGLGLSPDGRNLGVITMLGHFLKQAGWTDIQRQAMFEDYLQGAGTPKDPEQAIQLMANTMREMTLKQGMTSPERFEELLQEAVKDVARDDFASLLLIASFCARKPA